MRHDCYDAVNSKTFQNANPPLKIPNILAIAPSVKHTYPVTSHARRIPENSIAAYSRFYNSRKTSPDTFRTRPVGRPRSRDKRYRIESRPSRLEVIEGPVGPKCRQFCIQTQAPFADVGRQTQAADDLVGFVFPVANNFLQMPINIPVNIVLHKTLITVYIEDDVVMLGRL